MRCSSFILSYPAVFYDCVIKKVSNCFQKDFIAVKTAIFSNLIEPLPSVIVVMGSLLQHFVSVLHFWLSHILLDLVF